MCFIQKHLPNLKLLLTFTPSVRLDWSFDLLKPFEVRFVASATHRKDGVFLTETFGFIREVGVSS